MRLFKDRNLNIAILISTSWHLFWMFSVSPVLVRGDISKNSTDISFLGSILEKVIIVSDRPFSLEKKRDIAPEEVILASHEDISKVVEDTSDKDERVFFKDERKASASKLHYKKKPKSRIKFKGLLVSGAARNRRLLYRPDLSVNRILPAEFSSDSSVTVMFKISRHGFVETPECLVSSGSSEVDQMALRYVRKWQFAPLDEPIEGYQEGMVRVVFDQI